MAQLVNESDAETDGPAALGETDDERELVSHGVQELRRDAEVETESVGPSRLSDDAPVGEVEPDDVSDGFALEEGKNE